MFGRGLMNIFCTLTKFKGKGFVRNFTLHFTEDILFSLFQNKSLTGPEKRAAQAIGVKLRNLLKLPKAHKWVCYEWFYSNLDV